MESASPGPSHSSRDVEHQMIKFIMNAKLCAVCDEELVMDRERPNAEKVCTIATCHSSLFHLRCIQQYQEKLKKCGVCQPNLRVVEVQWGAEERGRKSIWNVDLEKAQEVVQKEKRRLWKWFSRRKTCKNDDQAIRKPLQEKIEVDSISSPSDFEISLMELNNNEWEEEDDLERTYHIIDV